jgi:hypothetical protein
MGKRVPFDRNISYLETNLEENRKEKQQLIKDVIGSHRIFLLAEGNLCLAHFRALKRQNSTLMRDIGHTETPWQEGHGAIDETVAPTLNRHVVY